MKQESKRDIVKRLRESLTAQQRSVPQLPAQARARKIKVLGAKTDPQHPFTGYMVGADESVEENLEEAVGGNYLYHATGDLKNILASGQINASDFGKEQNATRAQTQLPTVAVTRDWNYAIGGKSVASQLSGIGRQAIIVLDRNAVESNFKTLGTSQSSDLRGTANPMATRLSSVEIAKAKERMKNDPAAERERNRVELARSNRQMKGRHATYSTIKFPDDPGAELQRDKDWNTPKAGQEFEEAVVVPKGGLPIKRTMVGFYIPPSGLLMKDPAVMNDPRRLDLEKGGTGRFVKAAQQQAVAEGSLTEFAPGPERDGDGDDDGGDYNSGDDKINTTANAIVKLLKSRQPVFFQSPDGRVSQIRKISPLNVSPINQDADGNIIGTAAFDIVSKSAGGRNYLDQVAIQPEMYGIVPVLGKKIVMQVADQNLPPHLKRMRDTDGDLTEADFDPARRGFLKKAGAVAATAAMPTGIAGAAANAVAPAVSWASTLSAPLAGLTAVDLDNIINLLMSSKPESMISGKDPYDLDIMKSIAQDAARESWGNPWMEGNAAKAFLDAVELGRKKGMDDEDIIQDLFIVTKKQYMQELKKLSPEEVAKVKSQSLNPDNKSEPAASPTTGMSGLARAAGAQIGRTATKLGKATATTVLNQPARDMGRIEPTTAPTALPAPTASTGMQIPKQKSRVAAKQDKEIDETSGIYNPDGKTFRGSKNPMPTYDPNDAMMQGDYDQLDTVSATDTGGIDNVENNIDRNRLKDLIRASMKSLTPDEKEVLNLRYWHDQTLHQVANSLGLTHERIRQIEAKALTKLRNPAGPDQLQKYINPNFKPKPAPMAIGNVVKSLSTANGPKVGSYYEMGFKDAINGTKSMTRHNAMSSDETWDQRSQYDAGYESGKRKIKSSKVRESLSPFNDDHSELDQFVKEEFNRHPDDINEESGAVVAHGYAYNRQDQRVAWTREFASEAEAKEWARRRNATVLSIVPKPVNENNPAAAWPEFGTAKTYESQLAEAKQRLAEAESRYVLYFNGKPASHYATEAEAKRIADSIKAKNPTVKIEIKNEMHEGVAEGYKFKGGFPFDVDHMSGAVHKQDLDTKKKFTDEELWLNTVNKLNSSLYDDNSDYISSGNGYRVEIMGKVWAKWDGVKDAGWIETSPLAEGARVDRMVRHIASSEKATGKSNKDAENIAWATVNKRGYLDNKNKKKHVAEAGTPADIRAKNRAVVKKIQGKEVKEDITQEDIITKLKAKLGDYLSDLGQQIKKDPALQDKLSAETPGDQVGPPVKTLTTDDGHEISIHGNEDDGFRISIKNKQTPSKFSSLDEAVMACEMYRAHRRRQALTADYVDEA